VIAGCVAGATGRSRVVVNRSTGGLVSRVDRWVGRGYVAGGTIDRGWSWVGRGWIRGRGWSWLGRMGGTRRS